MARPHQDSNWLPEEYEVIIIPLNYRAPAGTSAVACVRSLWPAHGIKAISYKAILRKSYAFVTLLATMIIHQQPSVGMVLVSACSGRFAAFNVAFNINSNSNSQSAGQLLSICHFLSFLPVVGMAVYQYICLRWLFVFSSTLPGPSCRQCTTNCTTCEQRRSPIQGCLLTSVGPSADYRIITL